MDLGVCGGVTDKFWYILVELINHGYGVHMLLDWFWDWDGG